MNQRSSSSGGNDATTGGGNSHRRIRRQCHRGVRWRPGRGGRKATIDQARDKGNAGAVPRRTTMPTSTTDDDGDGGINGVVARRPPPPPQRLARRCCRDKEADAMSMTTPEKSIIAVSTTMTI